MNHPLAVGIADGVGDLSQHVEPLIGGQLVAVRRQIVIKPDGLGVEITEQQGRAVLVVLVVEDGQDAPMIERLDDLELTGRRPFAAACADPRTKRGRPCTGGPGKTRCRTSVLGQPILIARPIGDQIAKDVVADSS